MASDERELLELLRKYLQEESEYAVGTLPSYLRGSYDLEKGVGTNMSGSLGNRSGGGVGGGGGTAGVSIGMPGRTQWNPSRNTRITQGRPSVQTPASVGGGGGGGGAGGAQLPYQPGAPKTQGLIDSMSQAGQGLLDPNSDYSKRMREQMVGGIGQQTEAMQRGANLQASRAGFGSGAGAELLETQGDIGRAGLAAQGQAGADMTLKAPQLGGDLMRPALSAQTALQGQSLQGYMGQQGLDVQQQAQAFQAQLAQQQMEQDRQMQEAQMQMDLMMREMGVMYG